MFTGSELVVAFIGPDRRFKLREATYHVRGVGVVNGPSRVQVPKLSLIRLIDFGRRGSQIHCVSEWKRQDHRWVLRISTIFRRDKPINA
jgi:hypothetical protein